MLVCYTKYIYSAPVNAVPPDESCITLMHWIKD